jgi:hypothetical protein
VADAKVRKHWPALSGARYPLASFSQPGLDNVSSAFPGGMDASGICGAQFGGDGCGIGQDGGPAGDAGFDSGGMATGGTAGPGGP